MHHQPDFMMTMSPQVRKGRNDIDLNTEDTTNDHASGAYTTTNQATNYHSHAKISGRSAKKHSIDPNKITHHQMSATIPDQYEGLPGVKGAIASKSKKTF